MSHYEERLEKDLAAIRGQVADMADLVKKGYAPVRAVKCD